MQQNKFNRPVLGFAAFSGGGKTTLLTHLIPILKNRGSKLAVIKHAHHTFDLDYPGKDSYELRKSGANTVMIASKNRWAWIQERDDNADPTLELLIDRLGDNSADLIILEGFKDAEIPKIEVYRPSLSTIRMSASDSHFIAVASDAVKPEQSVLPWFSLNDYSGLSSFIIKKFGLPDNG